MCDRLCSVVLNSVLFFETVVQLVITINNLNRCNNGISQAEALKVYLFLRCHV